MKRFPLARFVEPLASFALAVFLSTVSFPPLPIQAAEANPTPVVLDGINKRKKRKKSITRPKAQPVACTVPMVEIYAPLDEIQVTATFPCASPISQSAILKDGKAVPLNLNGTAAPQFNVSKDKELAQNIIEKLKPDHFAFMIVPPNSKFMGQSVIAINKSSWSEEDVEVFRKLINEAFAPATPAFVSKSHLILKRLDFPRFDVALIKPIKKHIKTFSP